MNESYRYYIARMKKIARKAREAIVQGDIVELLEAFEELGFIQGCIVSRLDENNKKLALIAFRLSFILRNKAEQEAKLAARH